MKNKMEQQFFMLTNNKGEQDLVVKHLQPYMKVLEFGSGDSTRVLASHVRKVVSIEHDEGWYNKFNEMGVPDNVTLCHVAANRLPSDDYSDGTFSDFYDYVLYPRKFVEHEKFDVVFIDGRSRVACARFSAQEYLKEDGIIFIHDYRHPTEQYRRPEYEIVESFLEMTEHHFAMAKFRIKKRSL